MVSREGDSLTFIARNLERSTSTISRDIIKQSGAYRAHTAIRRAWCQARSRRYGKTRCLKYPRLQTYLVEKLQAAWSPDQIAVSLRRAYPEDSTMRISPEAIYQFVYVLPRGSLKKTLIAGLRHERAYRRKHRKQSGENTEKRGKIADMLSIDERPAEVANRIIPGHWEGDLIIGKHKRSAIATLVERTTRYTILVPLSAKDATTVRKALAKEIRTLPHELTKSLTYDQGKEMSEHLRFTLSTGMQVYFAHPGSPWERGTNENTNGLIRQYFPKGTDFTSNFTHLNPLT